MTDSLQTNEVQAIEIVVDEVADILTIPPKMQRFIHLYMTGQYTLVKLSELLEVHTNTLSKWLKRKDVKAIISDMQLETHDVVGQRLKSLSFAATEKLSKLINSPIDGVALNAVKDVLDRTGHKPKQEIKVDKTVTTYEEKLSNIINNTITLTSEDGETYE